MASEYTHVRKRLGERGINTFLQSPTQLIVALEWPQSPYQGNSFWLTHWEENWYISTWTNRVYRVIQTENLEDICYDLLLSSPTAMYSIPDDILTRYALPELSDAEVDALFASRHNKGHLRDNTE